MAIPAFNIIEKAKFLIEVAKRRPDYAGGVLVFVAITDLRFTHGYGLGVCEENVSGYWPLSGRLDAPEAPAPESWAEAIELQKLLNEAIGLSEKDAYSFIVTTMRGAGLSKTEKKRRNKARAATARRKHETGGEGEDAS